MRYVRISRTYAAIESFSNRANTDIGCDNDDRASDRGSVHPVTRQRPYGRLTPQRCSGVKSSDTQPISQDHAGSQETDPRDNLPGNPEAIV